MNTNELREICLEGEALTHAICEENNLEYGLSENYEKIDKIISENKSRYFEFKNQKAIEIIAFNEYSDKDLEKLRKKN